MHTLRIIVFGLLGVAGVLTFATIHIWRDGKRKKESLSALREMTPERLIANCGQPSSDTQSIVLDIKAGTVTGIGASAESSGEQTAMARSIEYRQSNHPYWVKLEFIRGIDNRQPTQWHLSHFSSPSVGVSPSDENAYIAMPEFPCMAKKTFP